MEVVVRPFQLDKVTRPRSIPVAQIVDMEPVKLMVGRNGSGKTFNGSEGAGHSVYCQQHDVEKYKEHQPRKNHVKRFYAEEDKNIWVDMMRIDQMEVQMRPAHKGAQSHKVTIKLKWYEDDEGIRDWPARDLIKVKVVNPENKSQWVYVTAISKMKLRENGIDYDDISTFRDPQTCYNIFKNEQGGQGKTNERDYKIRKVTHNELEENCVPNEWGFFPQGYFFKDLKNKNYEDPEQKVIAEFILRAKLKTGQGSNYQDTIFTVSEHMSRIQVIGGGSVDHTKAVNMTDPQERDAIPTRLDPFQQVLNVKWREGLAVHFFKKQN